MTQINELITLINCAREHEQLPPLQFNMLLTRAALMHSLYMHKTGTLSHTGANNSSFVDRINSHQYLFCEAAENIAFCKTPAINVFDIWMQSKPHKDNILNPTYVDIGVGLAPRDFVENKISSLYWAITLAAPLHFEDMTEAEDLG